ncbi:hypothetical protein [Novosphingobium sp. CECT 9465]|uniref:hypothetical protein n=1 Tax=Novosphingobium sp. CECT 9465 TaxID=2829794 RepID=UPI001E2BC441|nr:hypothetical protein [Novosphingobium sp. CECT 9465]
MAWSLSMLCSGGAAPRGSRLHREGRELRRARGIFRSWPAWSRIGRAGLRFRCCRACRRSAFAELHKRLWSWSGVPIVYRAGPGQIQLFRCAHAPDFVGPDDTPICRPIRTLAIGAEIAVQDVWWDAARIRNGAIWDDPMPAA